MSPLPWMVGVWLGLLIGVRAGASPFLDPPRITRPPASVSLRPGEPLHLQFEVQGNMPMTSAWSRDGQLLEGQVGTTLSLMHLRRDSVSLEDAGFYSVVVRNAYGAVTSLVARVSLRLAEPAAGFAGQPFVTAWSFGQPSQPFGDLLELSPYQGWTRVRWLGDALVIPFRRQNQSGDGLFQVVGTRVTEWLGPGVALPHGLGPARSFRLVNAAQDTDPLAVIAETDGGVGVGVYRVAGLRLEPWVDLSMPAPERGGVSSRWLRIEEAAQSGERVVFVAATTTGFGLFLAGDGPIRMLLNLEERDWPVGSFPWSNGALHFDGEDVAVVLNSRTTGGALANAHRLEGLISSPGKDVIHVRLDGTAAVAIPSNVAIPGENLLPATGLISIALSSGTIYASVVRAAPRYLATHVLEWKAGTVREPWIGQPVTGGGVIATAGQFVLDRGSERVLFVGSADPGSSSALGIYLAGSNAVDRVVPVQGEFDGRRGNAFPVAVSGNRVALATEQGLYVNTRAGVSTAPVLEFHRATAGGLLVPLATGEWLEWSATPSGPWEIISARAGAREIPRLDGAGFLRLRSR